MRRSSFWSVAVVVVATTLGFRPAHAGCGCQKPPPPLTQIRPNVTYPGAPVTLFSPSFQPNQTYTVTFTSGVSSQKASVSTAAVFRRDLADGVSKWQLVVPLPVLPLGPASIAVTRPRQQTPDLLIDDSAFTVAPVPVALPAQYGTWHYPGFQAAIGRDGTAYVAFDMTSVTLPMVVEAQAVGYALRFGAADVVFRNVQGFLMQRLVQGTGDAREPVPGMFVLPAANPAADADVLHYSRHEFSTYFLQHQERQPHALDPTDANWHVDGTPHVDHNHLILAVGGRFADGSRPAPGATPAFDLSLKAYSLFYQGLVGTASVTMGGWSATDSFDPAVGTSTSAGGDVFSNGPVAINDYAVVNGGAIGASVTVAPMAQITGATAIQTAPTSFMQIKVPDGLPNLGSIVLSSSMTQTINGPGSFLVGDLTVSGQSTLYVDNSQGPVTLYVTGAFTVSGGAKLLVNDPNPERFAVYVASTRPVSLSGNPASGFYGVVYAPTSSVAIGGNSQFFGAFVGGTMATSGNAKVHYYRTLRGKF